MTNVKACADSSLHTCHRFLRRHAGALPQTGLTLNCVEYGWKTRLNSRTLKQRVDAVDLSTVAFAVELDDDTGDAEWRERVEENSLVKLVRFGERGAVGRIELRKVFHGNVLFC